MNRTCKLTLVAIIATLFLAACGPKEQKIYIVSTNDMHANIDNFPQLAALIDSLRTAHPDLLLFSAGDNRSGNPINDRYAEPSKPMYDLMNAVGFNLSTFGNHEWDNGPLWLREALGWAKFPFVCANVSFDDTLQMPNVHPSVIFERNGLKIGVVGAIQLGLNGLPDSHPKNCVGSHFVPINNVLPQYLDELSGCNAIFMLSHLGYEEDCKLATKFPQLTAIFGGHSHTRIGEKQLVGDVMVTQAEAKVKFVSLSTFTFHNGKLVDKNMQLLSVKDYPKRDAKVQAMVDGFNNNDYFGTVLAYNLTAIESNESLGCLMADAIREVSGADMGFQNPGGVRFDTLSARPITIKDIFALDPFDNEIVQYTLTGQEIIDLIKSCFVTDGGPIYCSGCSYKYKVNKMGEMTDVKVKLENGKPINPKAEYTVVMNSYMSSVFDYEHQDDGTSTFRSSNDMLMEFLSQYSEIDYSEVSRVTEE